MQEDGSKLKKNLRVEAEICIVGCGPGGLTLARELLAAGLDVVVLESGSVRSERRFQALNDGEVVGDPYRGLRDTRHRQVGGAANIWNTPVERGLGAKYVPLDPWDLSMRPDVPLSGWPFDFSKLEPFYRRAQSVCGLETYRHDRGAGPDSGGLRGELDPGLQEGVYQFGPAKPFIQTYRKELAGASNVVVYHGVTVCRLRLDGGRKRVVEVEAGNLNGQRLAVRARTFVLCAGAVENARLLLVSGDGEGDCPGNAHGWVGRCFMEHPRDHALSLAPYSPRFFSEARFFDRHRAENGTLLGGRIGLSETAVLEGALPNASVTLLPEIRERSTLVDWAARFWLCPHTSRFRGFRGGYGWSRMSDPARWLKGFRFVVNMEQYPNPENRVVLSKRKDVLGVPKAALHWRWRDEEQADLDKLREFLANSVERSGMGRVMVRPDSRPDPNACHHAGTTRMHADPKKGVVDPDGRVHGMENLLVAGASVFPTAGFANPTLTIVAMALRLADHLRSSA